LGLSKKVIRLPGGSGEVNFLILLFFSNVKTDGTRPVRRLPFCPNGHKKEAKKASLLRRACSHRQRPAHSSPMVFSETVAVSLFYDLLLNAAAK
jgi:hypothetical protein